MTMSRPIFAQWRLGIALLASSLVSLVLFAAGALRNHSLAYDYLLYNLALAWIPLLMAVLLAWLLRRRLWSSWLPLLATVIWLGFLPNSFYMISDYIHLQDVTRLDVLSDVLMFSSFILNAFVLGLLSLGIVHGELRKRFRARSSWVLVLGVILVTSFAIYIGRDLRWNTWDLLLNPASVLFDVSDRLLSPAAHPEMLSTTLGFAVLITTFYTMAHQATQRGTAALFYSRNPPIVRE